MSTPFRDTDYQNQHPGQWVPLTAAQLKQHKDTLNKAAQLLADAQTARQMERHYRTYADYWHGQKGQQALTRANDLLKSADEQARTAQAAEDQAHQLQHDADVLWQNNQPASAPPAPQAGAPPPPPPEPTPDQIPTDPKGFQNYLNGLGAGLTVDGVIGPKTKAAAARYGVPMPSTPVQAPAPAQRAPAPAPAARSGSSGPVTQTAPATAAPQPDVGSVEDQIRRNYGFMAWAIDDPELGPILRQGIQQGWDASRLQGALQQTNVWKTTSDAQRTWRALTSTDPATANRQRAAKTADVANMAATEGINIGGDRIGQIAEQALSEGWGAQQLQNAVAAEFRYQPGAQHGTIGQAETSIKALAGDYLVPVADSTLADWDTQIARGTATPDTFKQYFVSQAKTLYPGLAKLIDQGQTTQQLVDPYRQAAAQTLEVAPDSIDFTDPKWGRAINQADPKTGEHTMMGLYDWQRTLRTDPNYGFQNTKQARDQTFSAVAQLEDQLGATR